MPPQGRRRSEAPLRVHLNECQNHQLGLLDTGLTVSWKIDACPGRNKRRARVTGTRLQQGPGPRASTTAQLSEAGLLKHLGNQSCEVDFISLINKILSWPTNKRERRTAPQKKTKKSKKRPTGMDDAYAEQYTVHKKHEGVIASESRHTRNYIYIYILCNVDYNKD
jgi:hypothetical protein